MKNKIDFAVLGGAYPDVDFSEILSSASGFRSICVHPTRVYYASRYTETPVSVVIGFPFGASFCKLDEAKAVLHWTDELDVVWDSDLFINKNYLAVLEQLAAIVKLGKPVKVIVPGVEYLGTKLTEYAYNIVQDSGAFCIKSLTKNATYNFHLLRCWRGLGNLKIKCAGGIGCYNLAKALVDAGADIIGTSSGLKIIEEEKRWK